MAKQNGTDFIIVIDGNPVAAGLSNDVDLSMETIEVTSKDSEGYSEFIGGKRSATMSFEFLDDIGAAGSALEFSDLLTLWQNRTEFEVRFSEETSGNKYLISRGYLTSISRSAPLEDVLSGSGSIQLTGRVMENTLT